MAIAYDTSGHNYASSSGDTATVNLAATGDNRIAIIFTWADLSGNPTVLVDGNAATLIDTQVLTGTQTLKAFYYVAPPTGAVDYTAQLASSPCGIHVLTYTGTAQTDIPDSSAGATGATTTLTLSTTVVADDCWLASTARGYTDGVANASTGTTLRTDGTGYKSGDSNGVVGTGSQTMAWTTGAGNSIGGLIVSFAPSADVAAITNNLTLLGVG